MLIALSHHDSGFRIQVEQMTPNLPQPIPCQAGRPTLQEKKSCGHKSGDVCLPPSSTLTLPFSPEAWEPVLLRGFGSSMCESLGPIMTIITDEETEV